MDKSLYESFLNSIDDCIAIYKVVDNGENFEIVEFNKAAQTLEQISKDDLIGKKVSEVFPAVKDIGLFDIFKKVYKDGKTINHPLKFYEDNRISGYRENVVYKVDSQHIMAIYSDVTKEKQAEQQLEITLAFLKSHQEAMDVSSIVTKSDLNGIITYANDNFYKITGFTKAETIGKPHSIVRHPDNPDELYETMWNTIRAKKTWKGILKNRGKNSDYWVDTSILPILDDKGEIFEYIAVRHDITETVLQKERLNDIANIDSLTGLGTRYKLLNDLECSLSPAVALIDIDNFSQINDLYGHKTGDMVIKQVSQSLSSIKINKNFLFYHLQGDEFVILHQSVSKDEFLEKIYELENKLKDINISIQDKEFSLNFTTAISFESREQILQTLDMALKVAKKENKSLVIYRDEISLNEEYANNVVWTKKIKNAIEHDNILPVFQAIVNNKTLKWEKYESLVRLKDEDKLISPYFFLDISKKTKQYLKITKIMIAKTFEMVKNHNLEFSVNLTMEDILNEELKQYIYNMLEEYDIGSKIVFEIVESESIEIFDIIEDFIDKVKSYGCKLAIDDFGTGYSNFSYLMKLKADFIKIDGSMIKNIDTDENSQIIVSTIVNFAKKMDIKTIAEFVENESIQNKVVELGVDFSQGYYFSKPETTIR